MGTITERRLKSGRAVYTPQVRIMRDGKKASASAFFERRFAAEARMKRKEAGPAWKMQLDTLEMDAAMTACKLLAVEYLHFRGLRHEGVSRLFDMGKTIPQAAGVSDHRSWPSLRRYSPLQGPVINGPAGCGWKNSRIDQRANPIGQGGRRRPGRTFFRFGFAPISYRCRVPSGQTRSPPWHSSCSGDSARRTGFQRAPSRHIC